MVESSRIVLLLLLLAAVPQAALAQNARIAADAGDSPLVINGWVGEENSFVGNIRLTLLGAAQGSSAVRLSLLFSDLKQQGGTETVGRQQVAITGDQTLTPDVPSTYQVKVTGVKVPGDYRGKVELLVPAGRRAEAEVVDVVLLAKARPALTPLTEADRVQASLVRCAGDCWLARLLLPAGYLLAGPFEHRLKGARASQGMAD